MAELRVVQGALMGPVAYKILSGIFTHATSYFYACDLVVVGSLLDVPLYGWVCIFSSCSYVLCRSS